MRQLSAQVHVMTGMNIDSPWPPRDPEPDPHLRGGGLLLDEVFNPPFDADDDDDDDNNNLDPIPNPDPGAEPPVPEEDEVELLRLLHNPTPLRDTHCFARSRVYDLRRYKESNMWGPFLDDSSGRIDWEKVQAIMLDIAYNHRLYAERRGLMGTDTLGLPDSLRLRIDDLDRVRNVSSTTRSLLNPWEVPFEGIAENSYVSSELVGKVKPSQFPEIDSLDPYGVTGTWMRIVCFLDYNDLYRYNFERPSNVPDDQEREPISEREAFRLIKLQLQATAVEEQDGVDFRTGRPLLPLVRFSGTSRSTFMAWDPNANSRIRGTYYNEARCAVPALRPSVRSSCASRPCYLFEEGKGYALIFLLSSRYGPHEPPWRGPLDQLLYLPRRRALAQRRRPDRRVAIRPRHPRKLVRQRFRYPRACGADYVLEDFGYDGGRETA